MRPFVGVLAVLLTIAFVVPVTFFIVPQRASAQAAGCVASLFGLATTATTAATAAASSFLGVPVGGTALAAIVGSVAVSAGANPVTAVGTASDCWNNMVFKPILRSLVRDALKYLTSRIIGFINNNPNTGQPSFVRNLSVHLQLVGDSVALPFISSIRTALNPQFGAAIASSLMTNYVRQTSVGGFLAGNQSTLMIVSPNPNAFLAGNFSQGGIPAWFALTTQSTDNPYMLEPAARGQLASLVAQATTNRRQDLVQSNGFLSWCGDGATATGGSGVNPKASCIDSQGKAIPVQTPGTVIRDYAQKALGSDIAELINPTDLDGALAAILQAVMNQAITGLTTGLVNSSLNSSSRPSIIMQMQTTAENNISAVNSASSVVSAADARDTAYKTAWDTITTAANNALASVTTLSACVSQASAAQDARTNYIEPVLTQAQQAYSDISANRELMSKVQGEESAGASAALTADTAKLAAKTPQASDVASAKAQMATTGAATASPSGSLNVSGGTIVDRMNLISGNAQQLSANCTQ